MHPKQLEVMRMSAQDRKARRKAMQEMYESGRSASDIAKEFGCSYQNVYQNLRQVGYQRRYFKPRDDQSKDLPQDDRIKKLKELLRTISEVIQALD